MFLTTVFQYFPRHRLLQFILLCILVDLVVDMKVYGEGWRGPTALRRRVADEKNCQYVMALICFTHQQCHLWNYFRQFKICTPLCTSSYFLLLVPHVDGGVRLEVPALYPTTQAPPPGSIPELNTAFTIIRDSQFCLALPASLVFLMGAIVNIPAQSLNNTAFHCCKVRWMTDEGAFNSEILT